MSRVIVRYAGFLSAARPGEEDEAEVDTYDGFHDTVTDADTIRLHRRANDEEVSGSVEKRHEVRVERESVKGERG